MKSLHTAALLCRVSTKEQQDEGYSLEAQERLLKDYCERHLLEPVFVLQFSETASKYAERKKFRDFIAQVKKLGIAHIVVEKVDRLTRSGNRDAALIDEWFESDPNRHVHFVKQGLDIHKEAPSSAKFVWNMHVAVAKQTTDNLSEEVRKAADVMLRRGIWPTKAPIGYVRVKANERSPIQIDPSKAPLVEELFKMYASGEWSLPRLTDEIHLRGLVNANNHKIMTSRIHMILQDPFYTGKMRYRDKDWEGAHQPIITEELFGQVQRRLKRKLAGTGAVVYQKHNHRFRWLAKCDECRKRLSWEVQKGRIYGYCKRKFVCTSRTSMRERDLEEAIFPHFKNLIVKNPALQMWIGKLLKSTEDGGHSFRVRKREHLTEKLKVAEKRREGLVDLLLVGDISKEEFDIRRAQYAVEIERTKTALLSPGNIDLGSRPSASEIYDLGQRAESLFLGREPGEQRSLLVKIFDAIWIRRDGISVEYTKSFKLLAKAVEATNSSKNSKDVLKLEPNFELLKMASVNKKDRPLGVSLPIWLTAWEEYASELFDLETGG